MSILPFLEVKFRQELTDEEKKESLKDKFPNKSIKKIEKSKPSGKGKLNKSRSWETQQSIKKFMSFKPAVSICDGKISTDSIFISCWNLNGLRAALSKPHLQEYMTAKNPDILCLNETKIDQETFDKERQSLTKWIPGDYFTYFNCAKFQKGYAGTAIITKYKPISVKFGISTDKPDLEGRITTAEFETFFLVCTYVPNSGNHGDRLQYRIKEWDVAFREYLIQLKDKKSVVVTGDLNVALSVIDLYETKGPAKFEAGYFPEERANFKLLLDSGFIDTFRWLYPKVIKYSYWPNWENYRAHNKGWRVDYFLVNKESIGAVKDSMISTETYGSDHCPVELIYNPNFNPSEKIEEEKEENGNDKLQVSMEIENSKM